MGNLLRMIHEKKESISTEAILTRQQEKTWEEIACLFREKPIIRKLKNNYFNIL